MSIASLAFIDNFPIPSLRALAPYALSALAPWSCVSRVEGSGGLLSLDGASPCTALAGDGGVTMVTELRGSRDAIGETIDLSYRAP